MVARADYQLMTVALGFANLLNDPTIESPGKIQFPFQVEFSSIFRIVELFLRFLRHGMKVVN